MRLTNKYGLPEPILASVSRRWKPIPDRISVTDLIGPPLIRHLRMKHWDDLEEDASDMLWMLLGQAVHYILEKGTPPDAFGEEKLTATVGGVTLSGRSDLWHNETIEDYKITSVYSFLLGDKPEWERQLNVYRFLWNENGFNVRGLKIQAILRDWTKSRALRENNYPKIPFYSVDVPLWPVERTEQYIRERIAKHLAPPEECTPEEKWTRPTTYAVMKKGGKRAIRVFGTREEAEAFGEGFEIVERPGKNVRCDEYCQTRMFCPYTRREDEK